MSAFHICLPNLDSTRQCALRCCQPSKVQSNQWSIFKEKLLLSGSCILKACPLAWQLWDFMTSLWILKAECCKAISEPRSESCSMLTLPWSPCENRSKRVLLCREGYFTDRPASFGGFGTSSYRDGFAWEYCQDKKEHLGWHSAFESKLICTRSRVWLCSRWDWSGVVCWS